MVKRGTRGAMIGALAGIGLLGVDAHAPHARDPQPAVAMAVGSAAVLAAFVCSERRARFETFRTFAVTTGRCLIVLCRRAIHLISKALDVDPTFLFIRMPAIVFGLHYVQQHRSDLRPIYFALFVSLKFLRRRISMAIWRGPVFRNDAEEVLLRLKSDNRAIRMKSYS